MYQTILDAMQAMAHEGSFFGLESSKDGEKEFQLALGGRLSQMTGSHGWRWRYGGKNEERYETTTLVNKKMIKIDLVGRHSHPDKGMVAIELKYVPGSPRRRAPSNPPGFPYDVAKDCLRLDLLRAGLCKPAGKPPAHSIPDKLQTYAIGMTNWPDYWLDNNPKRGWAANFYNRMRSPVVRFEGVIETEGRDSENTIALKRCHIAFGHSWTGEWRSYGEQFRYVILRPDSDGKPEWTHQQHPADVQSATIPFLNSESQNGWRQRALKAGHLRN